MGNLFNWPPNWSTLLLLPALFVGFTVHELSHAVVAFILGDTSQVERKRLSFNPIRHVSWLGMAAFLLVGLGWAKPVWVDRSRFRARNPDFAMFMVSVSGPAANILTALLVLFAMTTTVTLVWILAAASPVAVLEFMVPREPALDAQGLVAAFTYYMVMVNLLLAFFNLLPLPPLDGFQALLSLYRILQRGLRPGIPEHPEPQSAIGTAATGEVSQSPAQIHFAIGLDYHQEGQMDEAIARYRQAIAQDEGFALAYYNQGLAYWTKGRLPLATSAFRAAIQFARDPNLQMEAGQRLRELAHAEQEPDVELGPAPLPVERGSPPETGRTAAAPLDPAIARRVWLRLGIGGMLLLMSALMIWLWVTAATLSAVG